MSGNLIEKENYGKNRWVHCTECNYILNDTKKKITLSQCFIIISMKCLQFIKTFT